MDAELLPRLGSVWLPAIEAVSVMVVPKVTVGLTFTMKENAAGVPVARLAIEQVYGEEEVHDHVPGPESETKVVLAGRVSVRTTPVAVAGPLSTTVCV